MSENIVTRLREVATEERPLWRGEIMEAADEIERLRKLIGHLQSELWEMCDLIDPCEMCKE